MIKHAAIQSNLDKVIKQFNFKCDKKYQLIIFFGLLGDFDSIEYAVNLKKFLEQNQALELNVYAIAIGDNDGKEKFCNFTGFIKENLKVVSDNKIHTDLSISSGIDIGLGGWINMLIMLVQFKLIRSE